MYTKIGLFFLKRKWCGVHSQITFLQRQLRKTRNEYHKALLAESQRGPVVMSLTSYSRFEREFSPLINKIDKLRGQIFALEEKKERVRLKIVDLSSRGEKKLLVHLAA